MTDGFGSAMNETGRGCLGIVLVALALAIVAGITAYADHRDRQRFNEVCRAQGLEPLSVGDRKLCMKPGTVVYPAELD